MGSQNSGGALNAGVRTKYIISTWRKPWSVPIFMEKTVVCPNSVLTFATQKFLGVMRPDTLHETAGAAR